jgi:hypothetical protein
MSTGTDQSMITLFPYEMANRLETKEQINLLQQQFSIYHHDLIHSLDTAKFKTRLKRRRITSPPTTPDHHPRPTISKRNPTTKINKPQLHHPLIKKVQIADQEMPDDISHHPRHLRRTLPPKRNRGGLP